MQHEQGQLGPKYVWGVVLYIRSCPPVEVDLRMRLALYVKLQSLSLYIYI